MEINRIPEIISRISRFSADFLQNHCTIFFSQMRNIFTGKVIFDTLAQIC